MTDTVGAVPAPNPRRIVTRQDFGAELTLARKGAAVSIRRLARAVDVPASTLGGYFAGTHLPAIQPPGLLRRILAALRVDPSEHDEWELALWRLRGTSVDARLPARSEDVADTPAIGPLAVSIRPPFQRLLVEPRVRGRNELLAALEDVVVLAPHRHQAPRVRVLHGIGGSGKSTVALTVARRAEAAGLPVFWIRAPEGAAVFDGMHALAVELGATADRLQGASLPDVVWRLLNDLNRPWLLVFDEADAPSRSLALPGRTLADGTGWLRPVGPGLGTVLVTTRDALVSTWGDPVPPWIAMHRVNGLERPDGAAVLLELAAAAGDVQAAARLSERLDGLPLALKLAGRYLSQAQRLPADFAHDVPRTFDGFVKALQRDDSGEPLGWAAGPESRRGLYGMWELSLDLLAQRGMNHARPLLRLLACFGSSALPYGLLDPAILARSPVLAGLRAPQLWSSVEGLEQSGLISLSGDGAPTLRMHPVIRDFARHDEELRTRISLYLRLTTDLLAPLVRLADPKAPQSWARWALLADHCVAPLGLPSARSADGAVLAAAVEIASRAAGYLRAAGQFPQADAAFVQVVDAAEALGAEHPASIAIRHDYARLHYDQGRFIRAESLYRSVLAARLKVSGDRDAATLATKHYLARTLRAQGRLDEAETLLSAAYAARVELLGPRHPDTLTSRHGLADIARDRSQPVHALAEYRQVLELRTAILGAQHPATLVTQQYTAEMCHALQQWEEAETLLRQAWAANREVRGPEHPRTLACGHSLACLLHDRGRLREAEKLSFDIVQARWRTLGRLHPAALASRQRLGLIRLDLGDTEGAQRELRSVLVDFEQVLGHEHPDTVRSRRIVDTLQHRLAHRAAADPT